VTCKEKDGLALPARAQSCEHRRALEVILEVDPVHFLRNFSVGKNAGFTGLQLLPRSVVLLQLAAVN
jgi:hypothetical protein